VLGSISERFGVRVNDIKKWNSLSGNTIRVGQRLSIWTFPVRSLSSSKVLNTILSSDTKTYTVQPGDTLWEISKRLPGVSIEKIKSLNSLKNNKLKPGQKLILG
jgi:membrane-bound lytic murein transglycosylase D